MDKRRKEFRFNERGNHVLQKEREDSNDDNDQILYASMARMSGND